MNKGKEIKNTDLMHLFSQLSKTEKHISLLHSGKEGEWSILAWNPKHILTYNGETCLLDGLSQKTDVWETTERILGSQNTSIDLPFIGGFIGHFAYELGYELLGLQSNKKTSLPLIHLNYYSSAVLQNHRTQKTHLVSDNLNQFEEEVINIETRSKKTVKTPNTGINWIPNISKKKYQQDLKKIKKDLYEGEIYQACYTYNLTAKSQLTGRELFLLTNKNSPSPMSAYLQGENYEIISASPERFLSVQNRKIISNPIKGTRPRGKNEIQDQQLLQELLNSEKDKAELIMITDLLRNDLGKISEFGTVEVTELRAIMSTPSVWHTYSTITGQLRKGVSSTDIIKATFPGGSITGCPKRRTVKILNHLESQPRGVYTGCIGYLSSNGNIDLSIAIRTVTKQQQHLILGVGGGIVYDSNIEEEWQETIAKSGAFQFTKQPS